MKKIFRLILILFFTIYVYSCSGYKPIFSSSELNFNIAEYSLSGDKNLGNQNYLKLYNLSQTNINPADTKNIYLLINASKNKSATAKDNTGKILAYKINLTTKILIKDYTTEKEILNEQFSYSSSYNVQDQYFETKNLENQSIENLLQEAYQEIIIRLSENIL